MSKKKAQEKESLRKVFTFTLHKEDDKDLLTYLEGKKITRSVKQGLRLLKEAEENEKENASPLSNANEIASAVFKLMKEQGMVVSQQSVDMSNVPADILKDETSATKEEVDEESERIAEKKAEEQAKIDEEFDKLLAEKGGTLNVGGIPLPID